MDQVLTKGKGPIGQLGLPLGLPLNPELAGFGLAVWVGFFLVAGVAQFFASGFLLVRQQCKAIADSAVAYA